jgi:DNA-binding MarR family transcriptional regulator
MKTGSDDFDPHEWPFFWMTQAVGRYLQKLERALKQEGLDVSRWRVLMTVGNRKVAVTEIAQLAIVKVPTMLKIVQRMQGEGLVLCEARDSDARYTDVSLTAAGKEARRRAWTIANRFYDAAFSAMPAPDQRKLNALLRDVFDGLDD